MNLPNKLTLLRILLVPVFGIIYYISMLQNNQILSIVAAVIFVLAAVTDILDGNIARKQNTVTMFGKFIDPIADKLLVMTAFILLTAQGSLSAIIAIVFLAREFIISGFRLVGAANGVIIAAGKMGKLKTVSQDIAVVLLMIKNYPFSLIGFNMAEVFVYISLVLTIWSCCEYLYINRSLLKNIIKDTK